MPENVTAAQFARVERSDVEGALARIGRGESPTGFGESTRYDLLLDGRRFPTKVVAALAVARTLGRVPGPADFSGGEAAASTRMLLGHGFEIVTKVHRIGRLDASFAVGRGIDEEFVIVESRGPDRSTDCREGLERLLAGLGSEGVRLLDAFVDSTKTRAAGAERERLAVPNRDYPIVNWGDLQRGERQARVVTATGRSVCGSNLHPH